MVFTLKGEIVHSEELIDKIGIWLRTALKDYSMYTIVMFTKLIHSKFLYHVLRKP